MKHRSELEEIGFQELGCWILCDKGIEIKPTHSNSDDILKNHPYALYAFCEGESVCYIGKTANTLKKRFDGYKKGNKNQKTNHRIHHDEIKPALIDFRQIDILVAIFPKHIKWGRFDINLAGGLEDTLIEQLDPCWNRSGKKSNKEK